MSPESSTKIIGLILNSRFLTEKVCVCVVCNLSVNLSLVSKGVPWVEDLTEFWFILYFDMFKQCLFVGVYL
mgnify:CR=1 FL=1